MESGLLLLPADEAYHDLIKYFVKANATGPIPIFFPIISSYIFSKRLLFAIIGLSFAVSSESYAVLSLSFYFEFNHTQTTQTRSRVLTPIQFTIHAGTRITRLSPHAERSSFFAGLHKLLFKYNTATFCKKNSLGCN